MKNKLDLLLPFVVVPLGLISLGACSSSGEVSDTPEERPMPPMELIEGAPMYTLLPPDGIPAISSPEFVSVEEARSFMAPGEPVMGVLGKDGSTKCYSAWQLDGHEIVNDVLDGEAIAATW